MPRRRLIEPGMRRASEEYGDGSGRTLHQIERASLASRKSALKRMGLTPEEYEALLAWQGGGCWVCGRKPSPDKRHPIDHDHRCCPPGRSCGWCVRAILCTAHNTYDFRASGRLNSAEHFRRMADVIEYWPAQSFLRRYRGYGPTESVD